MIGLAAFLVREARHPEPIIRPSLFRDADFAVLNAASIAVNFAAFSVLLLVPYYLVRIVGLETGLGGLVLALSASGTVLGAWLGAGVVASWPKRKVQVGMGSALLVAAALFTYKNLPSITGQPNLLSGGEIGTTHLEGIRLVLGIVGNFALGALMTLGIGLYAPCMIMVSLLGMNPTAAFPIMMGSCAFLMQIAGTQFIAKGSYDLKASVGLTLGGIPAVLIAAYLVRSLPLGAVRWLVVVVVIYTAFMLLRSSSRQEN